MVDTVVSFAVLILKNYLAICRREHIYEEPIRKHLIQTDKFPDDDRLVARLFEGIRVVLCTLGTLSNPNLIQKKLFSLVLVRNPVVDEASQIGIFEYMVRPDVTSMKAATNDVLFMMHASRQHLCARNKSLNKACFFGDPNQCE